MIFNKYLFINVLIRKHFRVGWLDMHAQQPGSLLGIHPVKWWHWYWHARTYLHNEICDWTMNTCENDRTFLTSWHQCDKYSSVSPNCPAQRFYTQNKGVVPEKRGPALSDGCFSSAGGTPRLDSLIMSQWNSPYYLGFKITTLQCMLTFPSICGKCCLHWLSGSGGALSNRPLFCWDKSTPMTSGSWLSSVTSANPIPSCEITAEGLGFFPGHKLQSPLSYIDLLLWFPKLGSKDPGFPEIGMLPPQNYTQGILGCLPSAWKGSLLDFLHISGPLLAP